MPLQHNTKRFVRLLALANLAILGVLLFLALISLKVSHDVYEDRARQTTENLVRTLSANIANEIRLIDNALSSSLHQIHRMEEHAPIDPATAIRITGEQASLLPPIDSIRITDRRGWIFNGNDGAAVSVADRDYFQAARANPKSLVISELIQDRISKKWVVAIARARMDSDGSFNGIVYSYLASDHFRDMFRGYAIGADGAVTLRSDSMRMIARHTANPQGQASQVGSSEVSPEFKAAFGANPERGFFIAHVAIDGIERASAYQRVPGYPLVLLVGLATNEFFRPWWLGAAVLGALTTLLAAMVITLSILIYRKQLREIGVQQDIARLATEREVLLENGMVGMAKIRDRLTQWHNNALASLFGYEDRELLGTPTRLLYPDEASYERIGKAYVQLKDRGQYRTQLQLCKKDGSLIWIDLSGARLSADESLWMMVDISAAKEAEAQAKIMAMRDTLTGLPNRGQLLETMGHILRNAERKQLTVAVCFIDLDGFKAVNDRYGHDAGDVLLREVALRMTACMRVNDFVARLGGDEFVVILNDLEGATAIDTALRRLLDVLSKPISVGPDFEAIVSASIGVSTYPEHGQDGDALLSLADQAMYLAKRSGKNQFAVYTRAT